MPVLLDGKRKAKKGGTGIKRGSRKGFWRRILGCFGLSPPTKHRSEANALLAMEAELDTFVRDLAVQERRPVEEITADLLARGLVQRDREEQLVRRWKYLSPREQEVAALSCLGYTNGQIAAWLGVAKATVKTHSINAQRKFDVHSKADLIRMLDGWDFSGYDPVPKDDQDA